MSKRNAQGAGTIRKKTVTRKGKTYTYWEARYSLGKDPGTGKQIQKSVSGKTQKEVREKLQATTVQINNGTYMEPTHITVGQWLDIWQSEYIGDVKPFTVKSYQTQIECHLVPALGAIKLSALNTPQIQKFYNALGKGDKPLSPKSIKNVHGVLHRALQQAVEVKYIMFNPSDACRLPRVERKEITPFTEEQIKAFLSVIEEHRFATLYKVTLFTGMREGEILGLQWSCIDFKNGTITISKQLQKEKKKDAIYYLAPLKNDKTRIIVPAPFVMQLLKQRREEQILERFRIGEAWNNEFNLVFTDETGKHLSHVTVYNCFKRFAAQIGSPSTRFHDLRHSYAVAAIQSGDDIKTVQGNLGHATASFTLDVYGHVSEQMKKQSSQRMEKFIMSINNV